jgi:biopolymer transport protein ExbD
MRIPSRYHKDELLDNQHMTSMIDIVFLLLIFFVCASVGQVRELLMATNLSAGSIDSPEKVEPEESLLGQVWLQLKRTKAMTTVEVDDIVFQISGNQDHESENQNPADEKQQINGCEQLRVFLSELSAAAREIPVILDTGPDVPIGDMIVVYDLCKAAEFESIDFAIDAAKLKR